jgi:hypothetical protein
MPKDTTPNEVSKPSSSKCFHPSNMRAYLYGSVVDKSLNSLIVAAMALANDSGACLFLTSMRWANASIATGHHSKAINHAALGAIQIRIFAPKREKHSKSKGVDFTRNGANARTNWCSGDVSLQWQAWQASDLWRGLVEQYMQMHDEQYRKPCTAGRLQAHGPPRA